MRTVAPRLRCRFFSPAVLAAAIACARFAVADPTPAPNANVFAAPEAYSQTAAGEVPQPLPPVDDSSTNQPPSPLRLASFPRDFTEPLLDQPDNPVLLPEIAKANAPQQRPGFFQRIAATTTYLPRLGDETVGFEDTEVYGVFGVPFPTRETPLLIEPGTDFWVVDSPVGADLPPTLHDDYLEFHWLGKITSRWGADIVVTPGWHSDYQNANGSQAFRLESHGVAAYDWTPNFKLALGVAYWDRINAKIIPAGGFIWTPNEDLRLEIITPKPRIAYRISRDPTFERWIYIAGELGGGEWAIQQIGGVNNVLDYTDYRVMMGIQRKSMVLGLNSDAELGYVFGRQLQYQVGADQNIPSTLMARLSLSY
jgi:hypothetical protein